MSARPAWKTIEGFGTVHLILPGTLSTVCHYRFNPNSETVVTSDLGKSLTCQNCRKFARVMHIPTARM